MVVVQSTKQEYTKPTDAKNLFNRSKQVEKVVHLDNGLRESMDVENNKNKGGATDNESSPEKFKKLDKTKVAHKDGKPSAKTGKDTAEVAIKFCFAEYAATTKAKREGKAKGKHS